LGFPLCGERKANKRVREKRERKEDLPHPFQSSTEFHITCANIPFDLGYKSKIKQHRKLFMPEEERWKLMVYKT